MGSKTSYLVSQPHGGAVNRFKKGCSGNAAGRPKKYVSKLKSKDYSVCEINDTIKNMIAMNLEELKNVYEDKNATALETMIAAALKKSIQKGNLDSLEILLNRLFGKPMQRTQREPIVAIPDVLTPESMNALKKNILLAALSGQINANEAQMFFELMNQHREEQPLPSSTIQIPDDPIEVSRVYQELMGG